MINQCRVCHRYLYTDEEMEILAGLERAIDLLGFWGERVSDADKQKHGFDDDLESLRRVMRGEI
jgi:hypothetical protein